MLRVTICLIILLSSAGVFAQAPAPVSKNCSYKVSKNQRCGKKAGVRCAGINRHCSMWGWCGGATAAYMRNGQTDYNSANCPAVKKVHMRVKVVAKKAKKAVKKVKAPIKVVKKVAKKVV